MCVSKVDAPTVLDLTAVKMGG
ncbi:hypothetical protein HKBW3S42_02331, partial [Candidatus Hakubella thermalkaliphila]